MRNINFSEGEFYHIYNRGTEKRDIFLNGSDYHRFILLLYLANGDAPIKTREIKFLKQNFDGLGKINRGEALVDIGAYCLMPNHFHLLLKERIEGGISKFMLKIMTGYTMYFNKKYERNGSLWQGVFKAQYADSDEYLKYLFSYIHLNPVKLIQTDWREKGIKDINKVKKYLGNFEYSSYLDYMDHDRYQNIILDKKNFPEYFGGSLDFESDILDWLQFNPDSDSFTEASPRGVVPTSEKLSTGRPKIGG